MRKHEMKKNNQPLVYTFRSSLGLLSPHLQDKQMRPTSHSTVPIRSQPCR